MEIAEGTRKRSRSSGGGSTAGGDLDRLSALPDCLLHVIMSSLKARQVVQTCVLSTRWRHLWRSVPCLDVDIAEFRTTCCSVAGGDDSSSDSDTDYDSGHWYRYSQRKSKGWEEFEDFAAILTLRCNIAQLDSFRLDIDRGRKPQFNTWSGGASHGDWTYRGRQAAAWLRCAMKCRRTPPGHELHAAVSRRQRPGRLNLLSPSSCLWRLRRLHLCYVPLDDRFAVHLSSACRSLEDLELDHCTCDIRSIASDYLKNMVLKRCSCRGFLSDIASPTLKTLVIDGGSNGYLGHLRRLAISAPMVAYLRIYVNADRFRGGISINKMMTALDRASIHLRYHKYSSSKLGGDQSKLLCSVSNATSLELLGFGKKVLGKEPAFQEFQNLRNLLLGDCDLSDDFHVLRFFHRGSPNLQNITLRHCKQGRRNAQTR